MSRTHTGVSLCFQIVSTLNRLKAKQGEALFSDTCGKQRLPCPPKFKITGVNLHFRPAFSGSAVLLLQGLGWPCPPASDGTDASSPSRPPTHRGPETGGRPAHSRGLQGRPCDCRAHRAMLCRGIGDRRSQGGVPFSRVAPGTRLALCGVTAGDFARPKNSARRFRSASQVRPSRLGESQSRPRQKAAVLADRRPRVVRYSVKRLDDPHVTEPPVKR